jgi:3',5'-nucleoside bisphosphate phosphatase
VGQTRKEINIPNIPGYQTIKCDFHMHTVFSDGQVCPTIRVYEAWRDGLDVIAITDHINYRLPKLKDSGYLQVGNHNAPYDEAKLTAENWV